MSGNVDEERKNMSYQTCEKCGSKTAGFNLDNRILCKPCFIKEKRKKKGV